MNLTLLSFTVVEAAANPLSRHGPEVSDFGDTLCVSPKTCSCWKSMLTAHFYLMNICFIKQKCVAQIKYLGSSRSMPTFILKQIRRLCPSVFCCFSSSWWNFLPTVITPPNILFKMATVIGFQQSVVPWLIVLTVLTTVTPPKDQQRLSATCLQPWSSHLWRIGLFFSGEICCRRNLNFVLLVQHIHPLGPRPSNPESLWHQNVVCIDFATQWSVNCQHNAEASCCAGLNWILCKAPDLNGLPVWVKGSAQIQLNSTATSDGITQHSYFRWLCYHKKWQLQISFCSWARFYLQCCAA